jgi:Rieske Fe-S protein
MSSLTRRSFVGSLGALALAVLAWPRTLWAGKKIALPLDKLTSLKDVGGSMLIKAAGHELLLIRVSEKTVTVLNPTCTHEKCVVTFDRAGNRIRCPCHGSIYALDGRPVHGPAPRPLQIYPAEIADTRLIVDLGDTEPKP